MGMIESLVKQHVHGIYIQSIRIGDSTEADMFNGFFKNANDQIEMVCDQLSKDSNLTKGFNVIGFSQGGQFWSVKAMWIYCSSLSSQHRFM